MTQAYSSSVDYDSNRRLTVEAQGSESAAVTADLSFKRTLETAEISIEPRYTWRRFSDSSLGNGDDRALLGEFASTGDTTKLDLTASILDQSSLITELLESGIVEGNTHQRMEQAAANWTWSETERRQLLATISYSDVSYHGAGRAQLPGYRYPSGTVGERFSISPTGSLTVSAFGSTFSSDTAGNSNHEAGLKGEFIYSFSDRTRFDGSLGESSRLLSGIRSHGTDIAATLTHDVELGNVSLAYTRNLMPYGIGFLVERKEVSLSGARQLTPYFDATLAVSRIDNDRRAVLLGLDRRSYDTASVGLNWHPAETWNFGLQLGAIRTQDFRFTTVTVSEWRSAVTLSWKPRPSARSW